MRSKKHTSTTSRPAAPPRPSRRKWLAVALGGVAAAGIGYAGYKFVNQETDQAGDAVRSYTYEIVNRFPHDASAFTQGLAIADGLLYEGTGHYGRSTLRKVELETGRVLQQVELDHRYFGEGIVLWQDRIIQLTWEEETAFVYDRATLRRVGQFSYRGQGWGITHDGSRLIMSDGSSELRLLDPGTFRETGRLSVRRDGRPVRDLNELEYIDGEIYANVWHEDYIVRIAPETGNVTAVLNLQGLRPPETRGDPEAVLNGIAYDAANRRLFVTGKLWPALFEIHQVPAEE